MFIESQVRAVRWTPLIIVILQAIILIGCHGKYVSLCLLWVKAHNDVMLCSLLQQQGDNVDFSTSVSNWFHDSKHVKFRKYALFIGSSGDKLRRCPLQYSYQEGIQKGKFVSAA